MKKFFSVFLAISIVLSLSACSQSSNDNSNYISPSGDSGSNIISGNSKETIGSILSTGEARCYSFGDGYAFCTTWDNNSDTGMLYIINTGGEICGSSPYSYKDVISKGEKHSFNNGVALIQSYDSSILINTSGEIVLQSNDEYPNILGITENNTILVSKLIQTIDGSSLQFGAIDTNGNWILPLKEIGLKLPSDRTVVADYLGNNIFKIRSCYHTESGDNWYSDPYYFNVKTGEVSQDDPTIIHIDLSKYEKGLNHGLLDNYWYKYAKGDISGYLFQEDCLALEISNGSGAYFIVVLDKNGRELFEPIQIDRLLTYTYSEGLIAVKINDHEIGYIDKSGKICTHIPYEWSWGISGCHNGIVTNGTHYYDKNGSLLFE